MRRIAAIITGLIGLLFLAAAPAQAACTDLGSCSCSVNAPDITFGDYNPISPVDLDTAANLDVSCSATLAGLFLSYEVAIGPGGSGDQMARAMTRGADTLSYNLYLDSGRTTVWGDGLGGSGSVAANQIFSVIFPWDESFPVYGRLPAGQSAPVGVYADAVTATIIY